MGVKCIIIIVFCWCINVTINGFPLGYDEGKREFELFAAKIWLYYMGVVFLCIALLLIIGCVNCCSEQPGFKEFRNSALDSTSGLDLGFVNPLQNSIRQSIQLNNSDQPESVITFEPLPRILPHKLNVPRLPWWNKLSANASLATNDWFGEANIDFPRQQLHYLRECGQGWFGKVVEGEAKGVLPTGSKVCRVFVRILTEDASSIDQALFLYEAKPYRDLTHPNVLKLVARCLENIPYLLIFESCSNGDLKSYLKNNVGNRDVMVSQGTLLRMAVDIVSGLNHMLQNGFVHTDVAARNCLVTSDLRVKVGEYGISIQTYKEDYYCTANIALPIRWCAPETVRFSNTSIETKQVTGASCVWSYGVLLWELEEWCKQPYSDLTDDEVIVKVLSEQSVRLPLPSLVTPYSQQIYGIMEECWKSEVDRPSFIHLINTVTTLLHKFKSNDFEYRWRNLKKTLNSTASASVDSDGGGACDETRISGCATGTNVPLSRRDSDSGIDLDTVKSGASSSQTHRNSPIRRMLQDESSAGGSPSSSRRYSNSSTADLFSSSLSLKQKSPSLENLHGSFDNLSLNKRILIDPSNGGDDFSLWYKTSDPFDSGYNNRLSDGNRHNSAINNGLDFHLGPMNSGIWSNKPLFPQDSLQDDTYSIMRKTGGTDSLTDPEDEIWRKRIERGEITEKVKEKSKSVADLMILTHIDYSESSESDSLPSLTRQNSFNKYLRRLSKVNNSTNASLLNSLNFGSESNLPVVEKDNEFQETLKKIQVAKINRDEDSLTLFSSLIANPRIPDASSSSPLASKPAAAANYSEVNVIEERNLKMSSPLVRNEFTPNIDQQQQQQPAAEEEDAYRKRTAGHFLGYSSFRVKPQDNNSPSVVGSDGGDVVGCLVARNEPVSTTDVEPVSRKNETAETFIDVVLGANENCTLEYFKGLKTTLVDDFARDQRDNNDDAGSDSENVPTSLNDFLNDTVDDYLYTNFDDRDDKLDARTCAEETTGGGVESPIKMNDTTTTTTSSSSSNLCFCYFKSDGYNVCGGFPSDDSGRGTDQINSVDGSSDKSLEGCLTDEQMNEVKNRLEDVIANYSEESCCSYYCDEDCSGISSEFPAYENNNDVCCSMNIAQESVEPQSMQSSTETIISDESIKTVISPKRETVTKFENDGVTIDGSRGNGFETPEALCNRFIVEMIRNWRNDFKALFFGHIYHDNRFTAIRLNKNYLSRKRKGKVKTPAFQSRCGYCDRFETSADPNSTIFIDEEFSDKEHVSLIDNDYIDAVLAGWREEVESLVRSYLPESKMTSSNRIDNDDVDNHSADGKTDKVVVPSNNEESTARVVTLWQKEFERFLRGKRKLNGARRPIENDSDDEVALKTGSEVEKNGRLTDTSYGPYNMCRFNKLLSKWSVRLKILLRQTTTTTTTTTKGKKTKCSLNVRKRCLNIRLKRRRKRVKRGRKERYFETAGNIDGDGGQLESLLEAIRRELKEKLPMQHQEEHTVNLADDTEDAELISGPESINILIDYNSAINGRSKQLSPILEEDEDCVSSNFSASLNDADESSLSADSSMSSFASSDFEHTYRPNRSSEPSPGKRTADWNEALILDSAADGPDDAPSSSALPTTNGSSAEKRLNETYDIVDDNNGIDTSDIEDILDDNLECDSLNSETSSKTTGAQLSYSSSECGNLSDVFLSPTSSKNFEEQAFVDGSDATANRQSTPDSKKPNLPISEETRLQCNYMNVGCLSDEETSSDRHGVEESNEAWLKSFFSPSSGTNSLINFNSTVSPDATSIETHSLPVNINFDDNCWNGRELLDDRPDVVNVGNDNVGDDILSTAAWELDSERSKKPDDRYALNNNSHSENEREFYSDVEKPSLHDSTSSASSISNDLFADLHFNNNAILNIVTRPSDKNIPPTNDDDDDAATLITVNAKEETTRSCSSPPATAEPLVTVESNDIEKKIQNESRPAEMSSSNKHACGCLSENDMITATKPNDSETLPIELINDNDDVGKSDVLLNDSSEKTNSEDEDSFGLDTSWEKFADGKFNDSVDRDLTKIETCRNKECNDSYVTEHGNADDDDDDDDDEEDVTDFTPSSWNSLAVPRKSALRTNKTMCKKKSVSFKKQKYHCVYEYPKEECHYSSSYSNNLSGHKYGLNGIKNEISYFGDYSMFSDWELEDCDDGTDEEFTTYRHANENASKKETVFYSFTDADLENVSVMALSNNTASSNIVPFMDSEYGPSIIISDDNGNDSLYTKDDWSDISETNSSTSVLCCDDYNVDRSKISTLAEQIADVPYFDDSPDELYYSGELSECHQRAPLTFEMNGTVNEPSEKTKQEKTESANVSSSASNCAGSKNECQLSRKDKMLPIISLPSTLSTSIA